MKELKFRVWDKDKFIYSFTSDNKNRLGWFFSNTKGLVTQQYTGLKDKNGVEIYEGDIVKAFTCNDDTEFYAPVAFNPHRGYYLDSEIERIDRCLYDGGVWVGPKCEVVSNIYENPELLG